MATNEELRNNIERLEDRIKDLEDKKAPQIVKDIKKPEFYDILRVYKLYASLPVYTATRTGTPQNGEIYITDISGTRKINVFIGGTNYSITIT